MSHLNTLPPKYGETKPKTANSPKYGSSKLLQIQARFQAKQLEEKEEKLINLLEKQESNFPRITNNVIKSYPSSNSMYVERLPSVKGPVRQNFEDRRSQTRNSRNNAILFSPIGWDKSYPLQPVKKIDNEVVGKRTPVKLQSQNKYSGNYGISKDSKKANRRGTSLDRTAKHNNRYGRGIIRAQSQSCIGSSSEESYPSSRPHSGYGFTKTRKGFGHEILSPDDSPQVARKEIGSRLRDYSKPLPPSYKKNIFNSASNLYTDSAYSSHSSDRSDTNHRYNLSSPPRNLLRKNNIH